MPDLRIGGIGELEPNGSQTRQPERQRTVIDGWRLRVTMRCHWWIAEPRSALGAESRAASRFEEPPIPPVFRRQEDRRPLKEKNRCDRVT